MGRSPCCDKIGLKKGPWTPEEDQKLLAYIEENGHGSWRALPSKAGLQRCGKSCRLRWTNYLRPGIKRGKFNLQEEQTIIQLHALLGNRWSAIATHLPKRTDNEIKNYWNTHLKKRLTKMGIDPITHKPKNDALITSTNDGTGQSKISANLSHMAQWESARLEAEARLVRESRLRSRSSPFEQHSLPQTGFGHVPTSLDLTNSAWHGIWSKSTMGNNNAAIGIGGHSIPVAGAGDDLESPTSTLSFAENNNHNSNGLGLMMTSSMSHHQIIDFVGSSSSSFDHNDNHQGSEMVNDELASQDDQGWKLGSSFESSLTLPDLSFVSSEIQEHFIGDNDQGFTDLLLSNFSNTKQVLGETEFNDDPEINDNDSGSRSNDSEEKESYWDTILNLVNSSPTHSPIF